MAIVSAGTDLWHAASSTMTPHSDFETPTEKTVMKCQRKLFQHWLLVGSSSSRPESRQEYDKTKTRLQPTTSAIHNRRWTSIAWPRLVMVISQLWEGKLNADGSNEFEQSRE
jgi:hypothetical protein